jgi:hypothetical protein
MRSALACGIALLVCSAWPPLGGLSAAAQTTGPTGSAPLAPPLYITSQTEVDIPFKEGRPPVKVRVFISLDQGRSWDLYQEAGPTDVGFRFRAKRDAEFWFATQTVTATGAGERTVQMRLVVDTTKPRLQIVPQLTEGGKLHLQWTASDPFLAPNTVRLEWQNPEEGHWHEITPLEKPNVLHGQLDARATITPPPGLRKMLLRGEVSDQAGNKTVVSQQFELQPPGEEGKPLLLPAPRNSGALAQRWLPEHNDPYARQPVANPASSPRIQPESALAQVGPSNLLPPPANESRESESTPQIVRNPYSSAAIPARQANTGELPPPREPTRNSFSTEELPSFNGPENQYVPSQEPVPSPSRADQYTRPEVIDSEPIVPPRRVEPVAPPQGDRPRMTASKRFSLDYDIESVGPEGVESVELWGTTDHGRTWQKWGVDPDRVTPFEVEVANEATYGFRIVIVGKNGLASNTPQPGDAADIWVGVDLTKPTARLTGATIASGEHAGKLEIRWTADDAHFGPRPITLAVSDRATGPFTPIAAGLPNTGSYYWEFDPRIRRQLYLRLEAQDEAGNLTVHQLTDPILIEGLAPKGRIRDLAPAPSQSGAFRPSMFR